MAYGDNVDPKNRVVAFVLVGLFTAVLGYGLVNGLDISIVKKIAAKLDVVDVEEPPPPEERPPPPPPDNQLPPPDRKGVRGGKGVAARVDWGGRGFTKKKKNRQY